MAYLIFQDFKKSIQLANLNQVIGSDASIIQSWMLAAEQKAASYLTQKYQTELEFTDTRPWNLAQGYSAGDRVYLDAPAYDVHTPYTTGSYVLNAGQLYQCLGDALGIFNPAKWQLVGSQYTLYYAAYPQPRFDVRALYSKGDRVYYQGRVYTALQGSARYDDAYLLQVGKVQNIPPVNYFPGVPGSAQWGDGAAYTVPPATAITDAAYWVQGDNRNQEILNVMIAMVLYYAHRRISPMSIPDLRRDDYREAIEWLVQAGDGTITPNLPLRQPLQGNKIRYGGSIRNQNNY